jgi:hypothetical protein
MHEYPGQLSTGNWLYGWSSQQQQVIVTDLARYPNACGVHNPELVKFWNKGNMDLSTLPLVNYIPTNFEKVDRLGPFELMIRKGRHLDLHAGLGFPRDEPPRVPINVRYFPNDTRTRLGLTCQENNSNKSTTLMLGPRKYATYFPPSDCQRRFCFNSAHSPAPSSASLPK